MKLVNSLIGNKILTVKGGVGQGREAKSDMKLPYARFYSTLQECTYLQISNYSKILWVP